MTKKIFILVLGIGITIMSACAPSRTLTPVSNTSTATATQVLPTATITPTSSPTPIPTPPIISASNVMNLQEDFHIGQGAISEFAWLSDGNVAFVYSTSVSVYDSDTGNLIRSVQLEGYSRAYGIKINPNGKNLAAIRDNSVRIWNADTGKVEYDLNTGCENAEVTFNSDGSQIATCDKEGVSLWDLSSKTKIRTFQIARKDFLSIVFNPNNNTMATSGYANGFTDIMVWDLASGAVIKKLPEISSPVSHLIFNHQGNIIAWCDTSGTNGAKTVLYDINANQRIQTINGQSNFVFSPDDKTLTIMGSDAMQLLDIATGKFIATYSYSNSAPIIAYSPDGTRFIGSSFVSGKRSFGIYTKVGSYIATLNLETPPAEDYGEIAFDPQGKYLVAGGAGDILALSDLQTKKPILNGLILDNASGWWNNFSFSPNGETLIIKAWPNIVQWDLRTQSQKKFEGKISDSDVMTKLPLFSPSGDLVAVGFPEDQIAPSFVMGGEATYVRIWDVNSGQFLFDAKHPHLSSYKFSLDGKMLAVAGAKTIDFWDLKTQKQLKQFNSPADIYDIAFNSDGTLIAAAARNGVYVWDINSGRMISEFNTLKEFQVPSYMSATRQVAFSPQGNILASIGFDKDHHKMLYVWDVSRNQLLYEVAGDEDTMDSWNLPGRAGLLFSPDGSLIVTCGLKFEPSSGNVQFWNTFSGELITTLDYNAYCDSSYNYIYVGNYGFSHDGSLFAVADGIVHVLSVSP